MKIILLLLLIFLSIGIPSAQQLKKDLTPATLYKGSKEAYSSTAPSSVSAADTNIKHPVRLNENKIPTLTPASVPISTNTNYNPAARNNTESAKREFMKQSGYPKGRPGYEIVFIKSKKSGGCTCPSNMLWKLIKGDNKKIK